MATALKIVHGVSVVCRIILRHPPAANVVHPKLVQGGAAVVSGDGSEGGAAAGRLAAVGAVYGKAADGVVFGEGNGCRKSTQGAAIGRVSTFTIGVNGIFTGHRFGEGISVAAAEWPCTPSVVPGVLHPKFVQGVIYTRRCSSYCC
ncbi:MAG: hypothetical protein BWY80_00059 [Firmicutes bacterium ADurb.Bin456]|nr:MAG: hypothetical protein BWY80_00059 [Firmicutes bacterium ADurb.Bin456]